MPLTLLAPAIIFLQTAPNGHVWLKRLAPGLTYRMEWQPTVPRVINALKISLHSDVVRPISELAGHSVYEATATKGREPVSKIVAEDNAIAGVNGDFFPFTGDPLGFMLRSGEVLSSPYVVKEDKDARRVSMGWGPGDSAMGFAKLKLSVQAGSQTFDIDGLNEECSADRVVLDTPSAGLALAVAKTPNKYLILNAPTAHWTAGESVDATIRSLGSDLSSQPVGPGDAILVASGRTSTQLDGLHEGDRVHIALSLTGFDFDHISDAIGGGPMLIQRGQVFVDYAEERFLQAFAQKRHPRTAIGRTAEGDIWLVEVDGRSDISAGATLMELATVMQNLGCVDAMNLDGGGSSTMNLFGLTVNRPSDGVEREVANSVLIAGPHPQPSPDALTLSALPTGARQGARNRLSVVDGGKSLPNADVVWTCTGAAWIDQGGSLHVQGAGVAHVVAFARGQALRADYRCVGKKSAPGANPGGKDD
jgi:hypothetical protein